MGEMSVQLGHISPSRTARRAPFGIPRSRPKNKKFTFLAGLLSLSVSLFAFAEPLEAAVVLVEKLTGIATPGIKVEATFVDVAQGNFLVAICAARDSATLSFSAPAGLTEAINESGTPSQAIFYKTFATTSTSTAETTVTCDSTTNTRLGLHIYEYSGVADALTALDDVSSNSGNHKVTCKSGGDAARIG